MSGGHETIMNTFVLVNSETSHQFNEQHGQISGAIWKIFFESI